jgi:hypothetical protein
MSVMLLHGALFDLLTTAAVRADLVAADEAPGFATALRDANLTAFLARHFDDPYALDDWDQLEDDERDDQLAKVVAWRDDYTYLPIEPEHLTPDNIHDAIETWRYQVAGAINRTGIPWMTLKALAERT